MNLVVAMKQTPDLRQIRIKNRRPVLDDVPLTFGNIDKNALEAGVMLKEAAGGRLIVLSAGNEELEDTIKEALAAGADEAYLVVGDELDNLESSVSARILAETIRKIEDVGVILFGEGSGDNYSGQVGPRVAEILGWPQVGYACKIELQGNMAKITRSLEDSEEVLEVGLPVVVSVVADINEPGIPSVTQILKAGRKPKQVWNLEDMDLNIDDKKVETISNLVPEVQRKRVVVKSVEELVQALRAEGFIGR